MGIEEFIQSYTPEETEKIYRKDVRQYFAEKIAVQNIGAKIADNARERSPIRSP